MAYVKTLAEYTGKKNPNTGNRRLMQEYRKYATSASKAQKKYKKIKKGMSYEDFKRQSMTHNILPSSLSYNRLRSLPRNERERTLKDAYNRYGAAHAGHNPDQWNVIQQQNKMHEQMAKYAREAQAKKVRDQRAKQAKIAKDNAARIAKDKAAKSASEAAKRNAAENERKRLAKEEATKKANTAKEAERLRLEMEKAAADKAAAEEARRVAEAEEAKSKARQYVPLETGYEMEEKFTPEIEAAPPGQEDSLRYDPEVQDILARKKKYAEEGLSTREEEGIRSSGVQKMDREMQIAGLRGGAALRGREGASAAAQQRILQSAGLAGKAGIEQNIQERDEAQQRSSLKEYMSTLGEVKAFDVSESESEKSREMQKRMLKEKLASADRLAKSGGSGGGSGGIDPLGAIKDIDESLGGHGSNLARAGGKALKSIGKAFKF